MAVRDTARRKLTYEDYVHFPEDGQRHEILDGEHYVMPAPPLDHQDLSGNLYLKLAPFVREHRLGRVYFAPADVLLAQYDVVQPDLLSSRTSAPASGRRRTSRARRTSSSRSFRTPPAGETRP
jgi:Uma2 family endonuclease